jgi:ferredoxin
MPNAYPAPAELTVDWTACDGRGGCTELLPELLDRDDWGYPILRSTTVPAALTRHARQAVRDCPTAALRLAPAPTGRSR